MLLRPVGVSPLLSFHRGRLLPERKALLDTVTLLRVTLFLKGNLRMDDLTRTFSEGETAVQPERKLENEAEYVVPLQRDSAGEASRTR